MQPLSTGIPSAQNSKLFHQTFAPKNEYLEQDLKDLNGDNSFHIPGVACPPCDLYDSSSTQNKLQSYQGQLPALKLATSTKLTYLDWQLSTFDNLLISLLRKVQLGDMSPPLSLFQISLLETVEKHLKLRCEKPDYIYTPIAQSCLGIFKELRQLTTYENRPAAETLGIQAQNILESSVMRQIKLKQLKYSFKPLMEYLAGTDISTSKSIEEDLEELISTLRRWGFIDKSFLCFAQGDAMELLNELTSFLQELDLLPYYGTFKSQSKCEPTSDSWTYSEPGDSDEREFINQWHDARGQPRPPAEQLRLNEKSWVNTILSRQIQKDNLNDKVDKNPLNGIMPTIEDRLKQPYIHRPAKFYGFHSVSAEEGKLFQINMEQTLFRSIFAAGASLAAFQVKKEESTENYSLVKVQLPLVETTYQYVGASPDIIYLTRTPEGYLKSFSPHQKENQVTNKTPALHTEGLLNQPCENESVGSEKGDNQKQMALSASIAQAMRPFPSVSPLKFSSNSELLKQEQKPNYRLVSYQSSLAHPYNPLSVQNQNENPDLLELPSLKKIEQKNFQHPSISIDNLSKKSSGDNRYALHQPRAQHCLHPTIEIPAETLFNGSRYQLDQVIFKSGNAKKGHYYSYVDNGKGKAQLLDSLLSQIIEVEKPLHVIASENPDCVAACYRLESRPLRTFARNIQKAPSSNSCYIIQAMTMLYQNPIFAAINGLDSNEEFFSYEQQPDLLWQIVADEFMAATTLDKGQKCNPLKSSSLKNLHQEKSQTATSLLPSAAMFSAETLQEFDSERLPLAPPSSPTGSGHNQTSIYSSFSFSVQNSCYPTPAIAAYSIHYQNILCSCEKEAWDDALAHLNEILQNSPISHPFYLLMTQELIDKLEAKKPEVKEMFRLKLQKILETFEASNTFMAIAISLNFSEEEAGSWLEMYGFIEGPVVIEKAKKEFEQWKRTLVPSSQKSLYFNLPAREA